jgi:hypothetical protein
MEGNVCKGRWVITWKGMQILTRGFTTRWGGRRVTIVEVVIINRDRGKKFTVQIK